jgi:hypothetical protein
MLGSPRRTVEADMASEPLTIVPFEVPVPECLASRPPVSTPTAASGSDVGWHA